MVIMPGKNNGILTRCHFICQSHSSGPHHNSAGMVFFNNELELTDRFASLKMFSSMASP
jgi:hypothetical protein